MGLCLAVLGLAGTAAESVGASQMFIVYGHVHEADEVTPWPDGQVVGVESLRTHIRVQSIIGSVESGSYGAVFSDHSGGIVAAPGDSLRFEVFGGYPLSAAICRLTTEDVAAGMLRYDLIVATSTRLPIVRHVTPTSGAPRWLPGSPIAADFSVPLTGLPVEAKRVQIQGSQSGEVPTEAQIVEGEARVEAQPLSTVRAGEILQVALTRELRSQVGIPLPIPFSWHFRVGAGASPALYDPLRILQSTRRPSAMTALDYDRDGYLDLAVALSSADSVLILRNDGHGGFTPGPSWAAGDGCVSIAALDCDRDGWMDLATANYNASTIALLRNNGGGGFLAPMSYPVGYHTDIVRVADLDGNGFPDLVSGALGDAAPNGGFSVSLNTGGSFAPAVFHALPGAQGSLQIFEWNGDGRLDVVVSMFAPNRLYVYRNDGYGRFQSALALDTGLALAGLATGDLDGDGQEDVLGIQSPPNGRVCLYLNRSGTLTLERTVRVGEGGRYGLSLADLDGQGDLDVIVGEDSPVASIRILLNPLEAAPQERQYLLTTSSPPQARDTVIADLDSDGRLDVAAAFRSGSVYRLLVDDSVLGTIATDLPTGTLRVAPNPMRARLSINFRIGAPARGSLLIIDAAGRLVHEFFTGRSLERGSYSLGWGPESGAPLASGVYYVVLHLDDHQTIQKVVVVH